jgi:hypothetical protein
VARVVCCFSGSSHETNGASPDTSSWLLPKLLILTFIVSAGVGAFEVDVLGFLLSLGLPRSLALSGR